MWSTWLLIGVSLLLAAVGFAVLIWAIRTGQFEDVEVAKYRMLEDDFEDPKDDTRP